MSGEIYMFDSTEPSQIPHGAQAVAGYVDGHWPSYGGIVAAHPDAHHLSITVFGNPADCCDCEDRDLTVSEAEAWIAGRLAVGAWRPCVYANLDRWESQGLRNGLLKYGSRIRRWYAAYPGDGQHIRDGYDAHQYANTYSGLNADVSICLPNFFGPVPTRPPRPPLTEHQRTLFWRIYNHNPDLKADNTPLSHTQRDIFDALWNNGFTVGFQDGFLRKNKR